METQDKQAAKQVDQTPTGVVEVRNDKQEAIIGGAVAVGIISGIIGLIVFAIKDEKKQLEADRKRREKIEQRAQDKVDWINREQEDGKVVYQLKDGQYLVIDRQAQQKLVRW